MCSFALIAGNPAISNIELITDTGKSLHLGAQHVFCDTPLTLRLDTQGAAVAAVKICTFDEKMEIDAAMLSSGPGSPLCASCQPVLYRIQRQPPFSGQPLPPPPQSQQTFTDRYGLNLSYKVIRFSIQSKFNHYIRICCLLQFFLRNECPRLVLYKGNFGILEQCDVTYECIRYKIIL